MQLKMLKYRLYFTVVHPKSEAALPVLRSVTVCSQRFRCRAILRELQSLCSHPEKDALTHRTVIWVALLNTHSAAVVDQKAVKTSDPFCSGISLHVGEWTEFRVILKMGVFKEKSFSGFPQNIRSSHQLSQHHTTVKT